MPSKTKRVSEARKALMELFNAYLSVARGIDDLDEEDDIDGLHDGIDTILESFLEGKKHG